MKKLLFALIASACLHFSANAQDYMFNVEQSTFVPSLSVTSNTVDVNVTTLYGGSIVPGKTAIYSLAGTSFTGVFYTCAFWDMPSALGALWIRFGGGSETVTIFNSSIIGRYFYIRAGLAAPGQQPGTPHAYNFVTGATYFVSGRNSVTVPVPACSQAYYNNLPFGFVTPLNAGSLAFFTIMDGQ